jgi:hypothetical protein
MVWLLAFGGMIVSGCVIAFREGGDPDILIWGWVLLIGYMVWIRIR